MMTSLAALAGEVGLLGGGGSVRGRCEPAGPPATVHYSSVIEQVGESVTEMPVASLQLQTVGPRGPSS